MKTPSRLLSTTEFVLWVIEDSVPYYKEELGNTVLGIEFRGWQLSVIDRYACRMLQPLELKRLIPCKEGKPLIKPYPLEEPYFSDQETDPYIQRKIHQDLYKEAEEQVWFKGQTKNGSSAAVSDLGSIIWGYSAIATIVNGEVQHNDYPPLGHAIESMGNSVEVTPAFWEAILT